MTQNDKDMLLQLLKQAIEESVLHIFDNSEDIYEVDYLFEDSGQIMLNIKLF